MSDNDHLTEPMLSASMDEVIRLRTRIEALEAALREARQYVSDAGGDEDCEVQQNSTALLIVIDAALAPETDAGIGCGKSVIEPWGTPEQNK